MDDLYYGDASKTGRIFMARAIVTAPVIFSTAAGTGGPLLWNGSTNVVAKILKVGFAVTTVSTVAGALGLTGGTGQTLAPTSTTAADSVGNLLLGGPPSAVSAFRVGTVSAAGTFFLPLAQITTAALTTSESTFNWIDLNRLITVPPNGGWVSIAGSATLSTTVAQIGIVWEEVPV